jgi:uncharacterized membrane protein YkoI
MKRKLIGISAACALIAGTGSYQAFADKVPVSQTPEAVQKAIKDYSKGETLEHVERETKNGQTVYEAEFKREGVNRHVTFATDGTLLPDQGIVNRTENALGREPAITFSELPAAVQKTVKEQQAGRDIAKIEKEMRDGKTVYDVELKDKGANSHLYVASDGSMVVDRNATSRGLGERVRGKVGLDRDRDASTMTLDQTPAAVQKTIREHCDVGTLKPIKRELRNGRTQYDVEFEKDGKNLRMTVGEDGTVLKDNR